VLKKKSFGALFSEPLGSTVFIRPGVAVTRSAPGAALCWEAGAGAYGTHAGPGAALNREVGTGAAVTRDAPGDVLRGPRATLSWEMGTGAALSREVGTGATVTRGAPGATLRREAGSAPGAASSRSIVGCFL
jgi:hypothetical protein